MPNGEAFYMTLPENTPEAEGRQAFVKLYGVEPSENYINFHMRWLGPIPDDQRPIAPRRSTPAAKVDLDQPTPKQLSFLE